MDHLPKRGSPTLICFNHGNGLGDPVVLITKFPRIIRFCAKDTLWNLPVIGSLVKGSGAVPVYRPKEHGEKASEYNAETFRAVIQALGKGQCLGFAPEGVSRFLPNMALPLKSGVARITFDAVSEFAINKGIDDFNVSIVPVGIMLTHREKWRSDVVISVGEPIIIDKNTLIKDYNNDKIVAAKAVTEKISKALLSMTIDATDWDITRIAMTAARIHVPLGTHLSLGEYMYIYRGWVEVIQKHEGKLCEKLTKYQDLLDIKKVKDERIHRVIVQGPPGYIKLLLKLFIMILYSIFLWLIILPVYIIFIPFEHAVKKRERNLLSIGMTWNDSVAESKMIYGFFAFVTVILSTNIYSPFVLAWLFFNLRVYEEAMASTRSCNSLFKFIFLTQKTLDTMINLRKEAENEVKESAIHLPMSATNVIKLHSKTLKSHPSSFLKRHSFWNIFKNPLKRQKSDWNEILRVDDHSSMDYTD